MNYRRWAGCAVWLAGCYWPWVGVYAAGDIQAVIAEGEQRLQENQGAQIAVDEVHEQSLNALADYHNTLKTIEGLDIYNALLAKQLTQQTSDIARLGDSIANVQVVERQIPPLLVRMIDGLENYVRLDMPFLMDERQARIANLRALLDNPGVSTAEKTRRVFEAYQIENDYGTSLEAYKGKVEQSGANLDVDFLRVGRIALLYRSVGRDAYGYWDTQTRQWLVLEDAQYRLNIDKGLKMAAQEMAPELLTLPIRNVVASVTP